MDNSIVKYNDFIELSRLLKGDFHTDLKWRLLYATDASIYREIPIAVALPANKDDIKALIHFATKNKIPLVPRTAGTSIAGQVVGNGIIVDVSRYMNSVIEINPVHKYAVVQPGVILDELNIQLKPYSLFFAPETSTSNRCMIGGMTGNNSCGSHSLLYGSTRNHIISVETLLSDGSEVVFEPLSKNDFFKKCNLNTLEGNLYKQIYNILSDKSFANEIIEKYPHPELKRRNTGYALDELLNSEIFTDSNKKFNFCNLIAGSEGTLAFITSIKLDLLPISPENKAVLCINFNKIEEALNSNIIMLKYKPAAVEMIDDILLDCASKRFQNDDYSFFVSGKPSAIVVVEFINSNMETAIQLAKNLELELKSLNYGYHFSILTGNDINKIWDIRKAGLALLSNMPGDAKPVSIVEDTAVIPALLPEYIKEFKNLVNKYNIPCVYYGHLGAGELHIKPVLNLKKKEDKELLRKIMLENVELVKKYRGSLSGEHGDGRLRSEFVRDFYGDNIYNKFCEIKNLWDPKGIFNPGKIISNIPANAYVRYKKVYKNYDIKTFFDFSSRGGILRAVEQCTGSADCRKTHITGGIMCPTYMATLDESCTTRARANILREFLTNSNKKNPFNYNEIHEIMKLCLACKGCKAECASDIDMARLKSEFLYQWNKTNGIPVKSKLISSVSKINKIGSYFPELYNYVLTNNLTSFIIKKGLGFSTKRKLPLLNDITFSKWYKRIGKHIISNDKPKRIVYFFIDEFSEYNDVKIAIKMLKLFNVLGYKVIIPGNYESGRAALSRGLLPKTRRVAEKNIKIFASLITQETPLIGIEPSAILSFRDEYPDLVKPALRDSAEKISKYTFMVDEFLSKEYKKGNIDRDLFTTNYEYIRLHGHCHQKAIVGIQPTIEILEIPINYKVKEIKSGCCGMAGDFGYEKNNYELSMKIGELVLFPEIREEPESTVIVAPGTSCRYQIMEGTGRKAYHPVEVLYDALITNSIKI